MDHYTVTIEQTGPRSFVARNDHGAELHAQWDPEHGGWLATELLLASLGACELATLANDADMHQVPAKGTRMTLVGQPTTTKPKRIGTIAIRFEFPAELRPRQIEALLRAADHCPVKKTLEDAPEIVVDHHQVAG